MMDTQPNAMGSWVEPEAHVLVMRARARTPRVLKKDLVCNIQCCMKIWVRDLLQDWDGA